MSLSYPKKKGFFKNTPNRAMEMEASIKFSGMKNNYTNWKT